uniref:NK2 transcription factor related, locus 9 (Drosophila) n=1 Tax=Poecilia latipinna TaxID=48699 RepID=A0A3B3TXC9_9TELE
MRRLRRAPPRFTPPAPPARPTPPGWSAIGAPACLLMRAVSNRPPTQPSRMTRPWTWSRLRGSRRARSAASCSLKPRPWSWRGASASSATCPGRRGSSWPGSSASLRPRRSGSRTTATR